MMEKKIKDYVNYQFRFDRRENTEELKEEIIANLIDRYYEFYEKFHDEEKAYIEAIKQMGDFSEDTNNQIPEEFSIKPSLPDLFLIAGVIFSIFGLMILLLGSTIGGAIVTAISIASFSGAAYYLYSYSQYVRKTEMDIEKHKLLLTKIFKYMKTCFAFWAISLSFLFASIFRSVIVIIMAVNLSNIDGKTAEQLLFFSIVIFILSLIILIFIFYTLYQRLMEKYYLLTGETILTGKIRESYDFLKRKDPIPHQKNIILKGLIGKYTFPILYSVFFLISLVLPLSFGSTLVIGNRTIINNVGGIYLIDVITLVFSKGWYLGLFPFMMIVITVGAIIRRLINKISEKQLLICYYLYFLSPFFLYYVFTTQYTYVDSVYLNLPILAMILMTLLLFIRGILRWDDNRRTRTNTR